MTSGLFATWRDLFAYLRRPVPLSPEGLRAPEGRRRWAHLLVLIVLLNLALIPVLVGWQKLHGLPSPVGFDALPKWLLLVLAVLILPAVEECLFRGWLTGRPRALWLLLCGAGLIAAEYFAGAAGRPIRVLAIAAGFAVVAFIGWWRLRGRAERPAWFAANFVPIFYLSVVAFGLAHLSNYPHPGWLTVPMVLPQLSAGLLLGYARQRISLPGSILLHASSNAIALAAAIASG